MRDTWMAAMCLMMFSVMFKMREGQVMDLKSKMTTINNVKDKDYDIVAAAGLSNYSIFKALVKYLSPKAKRMMWRRGKATLHSLCCPGRRRLHHGCKH